MNSYNIILFIICTLVIYSDRVSVQSQSTKSSSSSTSSSTTVSSATISSIIAKIPDTEKTTLKSMKATGKSNQVISNVILNKVGVNGNRAIALKVIDAFFLSQQTTVNSIIRKTTTTNINKFQSINSRASLAVNNLPIVKKNNIDTKKSVDKASINAEKTFASTASVGEAAKAAAKQASAKASAAAASFKKSLTATTTTTKTRNLPGAKTQTVQVGANGQILKR